MVLDLDLSALVQVMRVNAEKLEEQEKKDAAKVMGEVNTVLWWRLERDRGAEWE